MASGTALIVNPNVAITNARRSHIYVFFNLAGDIWILSSPT